MSSGHLPIIMKDDLIYKYGAASFIPHSSPSEVQQLRKKLIMLAKMVFFAREVVTDAETTGETSAKETNAKTINLRFLLNPKNYNIFLEALTKLGGGLTRDRATAALGFTNPNNIIKLIPLWMEVLNYRAETFGKQAMNDVGKWKILMNGKY